MDERSTAESPSVDDGTPVADLRADLDTANDQLARLVAEYEQLLSDPDTIQEDRDTTAQLVTQARAMVARAETALERAEAGRYGTCERCGAPIAEERLAALPDATTCVACA
jgi:DnaK suppressor protein